jgi:diguanylate cyclase
VAGVEALLRWDNAARGQVAPAEFIPVAEATGLIRAIGRWVLEEACAQGRRWREQGMALRVSVNVSPLQLRRTDFAELVAATLARNGLPPDQLCLELPESVLTDERLGDGLLERIAGTGVGIALDDFGTGRFSLLGLQRLSVHQVKIDRSFVQLLERDADSEAIVRATVELTHSLGKRVVAEGVETGAQHRFLAALGCDRAQGFAYARPDRPEALASYLAAQGCAARS